MKKIVRRRNERGASIIMVALAAVLLIFLLWIAFQYFVVMGGSNELRNAVDAAALNVSKRVVEIKIPANYQYADVADSTNQISATNINRVWGKACLINANEQEMQMSGLAGNSAGNAEQAYQLAQGLNDQLHTAIMDKGKLDKYFEQIAVNRPAKMLGSNATAKADETTDWAAACVDRGEESNLVADPQQFPRGVNIDMVKRGKKMYIKGYHQITANNKNFCFTVFRSGEMPHLISDSYFEQNRKSVPGATMPIPNSFKQSGVATGNQASLQASACAVVNPQQRYTLAIPYSYVTIRFVNQCEWFVEGKLYKKTSYNSREPKEEQGIQDYKLKTGGFLNGWTNLGNEYKQANLWQGLNALPGDHTAAVQKMLQRVQEIDPSFTQTQLKALLQTQFFTDANQKYFIYPTYNSPDHTDPKINIQPDSGNLPGWLQKADADGEKGLVVTEEKQKDKPNWNRDQIYGGQSPTGKHWTECSGNIDWRPGTGFAQCLGELTVARLTQSYFTGLP